MGDLPRLAAAPAGREFSPNDYYSYLLNVYDRLADLAAANDDPTMEKVRADWPPASLSQEQIAELRASREEAYWVARFRQVREVIDTFYPEVTRR